ncbi:unnamed protein product [Triticum turgidum subsp. durum]|uniref:Uncharacterized protein n=2 Tax=Triticum TaxID=4564 RepID=A0A9R0TW38_TRITD|nr:unnamed protein product [Triticum turgidum subsp. durum]
MTSSRLSEESGRIFVHFNDNTELEARRLVSADRFTLLEVDYKAGCRYAIQNQLMSAPVFDLNGKVIGLVTSQCGTDKTKNDIKIGLLASHAQKIRDDLLEESKKEMKVAERSEESKQHEEGAETNSSAGTRFLLPK